MRLLCDRLAGRFLPVLIGLPGLIVFFIFAGLFWKSRGILLTQPLSQLFFSTAWHPSTGQFGFWAFIVATIWVTAVALVLALPVAVLAATYLSGYAATRLKNFIGPVIDLLAGLPSVIYGVWGVLVVVPLVRQMAALSGKSSTGYSILTAGIVLAIMVLPTIMAISLEVLEAVPGSLREAALSLGATKWEMIRHVVLRKAGPGIVAAAILGFSRAFGETMAVLMVVGNVPIVPKSVFAPAYTLPALIANNYGEMMSVPSYDAALMLAAFILLVVVIASNIAGRRILVRLERRAK